jgi:hypothetical protein
MRTNTMTPLPAGCIPIRCSDAVEGVTDAVVETMRHLADLHDGDVAALLIANPPTTLTVRRALVAAVRSLMHAHVLERPGIRLNLIVGGSQKGMTRAVRFALESAFVDGATFDLGEPA